LNFNRQSSTENLQTEPNNEIKYKKGLFEIKNRVQFLWESKQMNKLKMKLGCCAESFFSSNVFSDVSPMFYLNVSSWLLRLVCSELH
jgi:predicted nucleotidyltransferase